MKAIAIFFVSIALLSAADSAPSGEIGKQDASVVPVPNIRNPESTLSSHVAHDPKLPEEQKKTETADTHGASDSEKPGLPTSSQPPQPTPPPNSAQSSSPHLPQTRTIPSNPTNIYPTTTTKAPSPTTKPTPTPTSSTSTTNTPSPTTLSTTTAAPITSTTTETSTHQPPPTPSPPSPTPPSTTARPSPSTPAPKPAERHFDGPSFIGGAVLVLGLGAICGVLYMFYKARTDQNYRTLSEETSVI